MKNSDLIVVENDEMYVGSWTLAQGFDTEHRYLTRLLNKYQSEFLEFEEKQAAFKRRPVFPKTGSKFDEYLLNEGQAIYLTTLLTNNEKVRKFKRHLTTQFLRQRKILNNILNNRQNSEWLEKRRTGKLDRRVETDAIKEFIEYAKTQGSEHAGTYYINISTMENKALFNLELISFEYKNFRDIVNGLGLDALKIADHIVAKALKDGMTLKMYYKEIFQEAKRRVESFVEVFGKITVTHTDIKAIA